MDQDDDGIVRGNLVASLGQDILSKGPSTIIPTVEDSIDTRLRPPGQYWLRDTIEDVTFENIRVTSVTLLVARVNARVLVSLKRMSSDLGSLYLDAA